MLGFLWILKSGKNWIKPEPLISPLPGEHFEKILTAAGFHGYKGKLIVYYGQYEYDPALLNEELYRLSGHMGTNLPF